MQDEASELTTPVQQSKRLMISKMVLENFKSYAGKQEIGPFHKRFSSVVGPNGSGKSNVIDAMLFVFGRRANQLRLKKVSELIHNSAKFQHLDSCTVYVHFQEIIDREGDAYDVVPGSEFIVSRTARKDNTSEYRINGTVKKVSDVIETLKSQGIDLDHNRFLILQGEVEQIAMMKPKAAKEDDPDGFLEYLEDIIGTSHYKQLIEQAANDVETHNTNRQEKLDRLKIAEKEKDALEGAKDEAQVALNKELSIHSKRGDLARIHHYASKINVEELSKKKEQFLAKLQKEQDKMDAETQKAAEFNELYQKTKKEHEKLKKEMEECKKDWEGFERKDVACREELKHTEKKKKALKAAIEKEANAIAKLEKDIENAKGDIERKQTEATELEPQLEKEDKKLDEMEKAVKGEKEELCVRVEAKQRELLPHKELLDKGKANKAVHEQEIELIESSAKNAADQVRAAQQKLEDARKRRDELTVLRPQLAAQKTKAEKTIQDRKAEKEELTAKEQQLTASVKSMQGTLAEQRAAQSAAASQSGVLSALLKAKKDKHLRGVHNRLGNLATISEKYDVAITMACGSLHSIVVDDADCGQKCIEFLKENNIGRGNFMLMDKMEANRKDAQRRFEAPPGTERLFDLIQIKDDKYTACFYYALRDTLVANDLETATRVGLGGSKRHRVVTLTGQLVEPSGAMSGGGNRTSRGGMITTSSRAGSKEAAAAMMADMDMSTEELAKLENDLRQQDQELRRIHERKQELGTEIHKLEEEVMSLEGKITKAEVDLKDAVSQERTLADTIARLTPKMALSDADKARVEGLQKKIRAIESKYSEAEEKATEIEAEIKALQKEIENVGGPKMRSQRHKKEDLKKQISNLRSAVTKLQVDLKSNEKTLKKSKDSHAANEKDLAATRQNSESIKKELDAMVEEARACKEKFQKAEEALKEKEEVVNDLSQQHIEYEKEVEKIRVVVTNIQTELDQCAAQVNDNEKKAKYWDSELNKFRKQAQRLMEDFGSQEGDQPESYKSLMSDFTQEQIEELTERRKRIESEVAIEEEELKKKGSANLAVLKEYRRKEVDYLNKKTDLEKATEERNQAVKRLEDLRKARHDEFRRGFDIINGKLREMYQMITLGGDAELELVDSLDPFREGIKFSVRPPRKSWKEISNLSGGEKTLSSLSLVFALHHFKPTPLYVMDEIDAALDFKNVSIVANYIKDRTKDAQFVIISLRNNMFELADRLVGIYKTDNTTKSVTINPRSFGRLAQSEEDEEADKEEEAAR